MNEHDARPDAHLDDRDPGRLTPNEDHALRRLHWFETLGCELSSAVSALKEGFRRRDRRAYIRDPYAAYDPDKRRVTVVNPNTDSYYTGPKR